MGLWARLRRWRRMGGCGEGATLEFFGVLSEVTTRTKKLRRYGDCDEGGLLKKRIYFFRGSDALKKLMATVTINIFLLGA